MAAPDLSVAESGVVQTKLASAVGLYQQRKFALAKAACDAVLEIDPKQFDAIHLLAVIAAHGRDFQGAVDLFSKAIEINPLDAEPYANRGNALRSLKQLDAAVASYDQAIALKPDYAEAHSNRGNALSDLQQYEAALRSYDQALSLAPNQAGSYFNRGNVYGKLKDIEAAVASYTEAIRIKPNYPQALFKRGTALSELKQWQAAVHDFDKVIALKPDHTKAYLNRGLALAELKQTDAAIESYNHAIRLNPEDDQTHFNRGNALLGDQQFEAAIASYDLAIDLNPNHSDAFINRGNALSALGQHDAAMVSWDLATIIKPNDAIAHWNKALGYLLQGDFDRGWRLYEWRWRYTKSPLVPLDSTQPTWRGRESLQGKRIVLSSEQGLGDTIQFIRYARLVAERGGRVIARVPPELMQVLSGVEGVSELMLDTGALPDFDFQCSLLSLPLAFRTTLATIPSASAYLKSDPARLAHWKQQLGARTKPRVGIVWRGRAGHVNDHNRSIALAALVDFLPAGFDYISLQKEMPEADAAVLAAHPQIRHFEEELRDLSDTAALCELMDVVVCVDTSVAHLSAALGRPTWILLPFVPDWRWLLDRDDSPWYPTAKLYRQGADRQWKGVFERVRADLISRIEA